MSPRYAAKRDSVEASIYAALKAAGCDVERGQDCDLYVRIPSKAFWSERAQSFLLECKTPGNNAKRRQPIQKRLAEIFGDQYKIVDSPESALAAVGLK